MKQLANIFHISLLVLLCGCGGGGKTSGPPPQGTNIANNIAGNWQFSTTSTVPGTAPMKIAGSINLSGSAVSGAVHVEGSNCFDRLTTIGLTGTLTGSNISLTSTPAGGQITTFTGSLTDTGFTGTYTINGGCADGDQGNVTGIKIPFIANILSGIFTASGGETFDVAADIAQGSSASLEGSFAITGTATFRTSCFSSGTIMTGTFSSGSFIIGTSVSLLIQTGNGTVAFLGTENLDKGEISGNYTVVGGTCDQTGTGVLTTSSPWDY